MIYKQECVEICNYKEFKNKSCILNYKDSITDTIYNSLIKKAEDEFTSVNYDKTNLEIGNWK